MIISTSLDHLASDEDKRLFAAAYTTFVTHLQSLGFVEDTTYVQGTIRNSGFYTEGQVEHLYMGSVEGASVSLFTRSWGGYWVGLDAEVGYSSTGTEMAVAKQVEGVEWFRDDIEAWLETYEREHPMPD